MNDMELYIAKDRPTLNPVTKAFLKGHVPFNKGKRWKEWMSKDAQLRAMRGWKNLKGRMDLGGWNRRAVVMIRDDGRWFIFPSILEAGRKTGVSPVTSTPYATRSASTQEASDGSLNQITNGWI